MILPSVPKRKRLRSRQTIRDCRKPYCEVCGEKAYGGPHHIVSVGSGGPDHVYNLIQLCGVCHYNNAAHIPKHHLFERVAKREGVSVEEVGNTVWGLKV